MRIQRFNKYIKEQNWFAVLIELFVVFLAVFIGLQADTWNEQRIAKSTAKTYYVRLIEDLRAEESTRLARIAYYEIALSHGNAALNALQNNENDLGEQFLIDLYQATQIWNYTPQRATYDELLSIGIANAIPDQEIRYLLANYYLALENSKLIQQERAPFRINLRHKMPHQAQAAIRKNCGDKFSYQENGVVSVSLPQSCVLNIDSTVVTEAVNQLRLYNDLMPELTYQLSGLENKLFNLHNYLSPTRDIITQLSESVN